MYLSRLELFGFKSFAQRTLVDFSSGVTCVVGPNGCGKTNILDSVRWVLGEQKSSTLRSDKMESVIFAGSRHRKPQGFAEVSLTIENSRGILPMEYSQILITRRLYRSGESEYMINRQPCRLKDINDLFMDTGMGPGSYSVIELKMVEDLLSDRPEERRHLFEEAAGVTKYKHRRRAALRKLDETRQHLLRLEDVVSEAERQVAVLKRQVKRTERYRELNAELRDTDLNLARADLMAWSERLDPLKGAMSGHNLETSKLDRDLAEVERDRSALQTRVMTEEQHQEQVEQELRAAWENCRKLEEEALVNRERLRALERDLDRMARERVDLEPRLEESASRRSGLAAQLDEVRGSQGALDDEFRKANQTLEEASGGLEDLRRRVEKARAAVLDVLGRHSRTSSSLAALSAGLDGDRRRREDLEDELRLLKADRELRGRDAGALKEKLAEAREKRGKTLESVNQAIQQQESARDTLQEKRREHQEMEGERRSLQARIKLLEGLLSRFEGVPGGARLLLESDEEGVIDVLGNLLHADEALLPALEAALGEAAGYLVLRDTKAMEAASNRLREAGKGACTLLNLERVPASVAGAAPAGASPFAEKVHCEERLRALVNFLFRNVWLLDENSPDPADDAAEGLYLRPNGEAFWPPLKARRGSGGENGHLGLRYQLDGLLEERSRCDTALAERVSEETAASEALKRAGEELEERRGLLSQSDEALRDLERKQERFTLEDERAARDAEQFERSLAELKRRMEEQESREGELKRLLDELRVEREEAEEDSLRLGDRLEAENQRHGQLAEARSMAQSAAIKGRTRLEGLERELEQLDSFVAEGRQRMEQVAREMEEGAERRTQMETRRDELEKERIVADEARARAQDVLDARRRELAILREKQQELQKKESELRGQRDGLKDEQHQAELEVRELEAKTQALKERVQEEYEQELRLPPIEERDELRNLDRATARSRVAELRDGIRRLGPVNLLAIEEYETENERCTFLRAQLDDLRKAEGMLQETIERINRVASELFFETFGKIRENFEYLFLKLFSDGKADLRLEGEDPLEADIQISATPSGKKIQNLMLMSGGEKTLTAIALLFAIYMVKPSPFCILDEVDAPLDDANIARFNTIIQEFAGMTQFIIITHNKKTMGYADQLYGVTMAEEGVSTLVSVKFSEQAHQLAQAAS